MSKSELSPADYDTGESARLCPGCGHIHITAAIKKALAELEILPEELNLIAGIGCSGKAVAEIKCNGLHTLHGCAPPMAMGSQLANPDQTHLILSGDGDSWAIGAGKMIAMLRTNFDALHICMNNGTYGLTRGQLSPTTQQESPTHWGLTSDIPPVDGIGLAMLGGATMVARGFSAKRELLVEQIKAGILHEGLAYLEVFSPCVTFNDHEGSHHSYKYAQKHFTRFPKFSVMDIEADYPSEQEVDAELEGEGEKQFGVKFEYLDDMPEYDPTDMNQALQVWEKYWTQMGIIPIGLFYVNEEQKSHHLRYYNQDDQPLAKKDSKQLRPTESEFETILEQFK
ncbi:MAG: thiamine pyrophosphate-dependent enzyme [bacterium]